MRNKPALLFLLSVSMYLLSSVVLPVLWRDADATLLVAVVQIVCILAPALAGIKLLGKDTMFLHRPRLGDVFMMLLITLGMMWVVAYCNIVSMFILSRLGLNIPPNTLAELGDFSFLAGVLVVILLPAVGEELLFRGVLLGGHSGRGAAAVVMSGVMFALMHVQPHTLVALAIMGVTLGAVAYRTRSVFLCMMLHAANNLVPLLVTQAFRSNPLLSEMMQQTPQSAIESLSSTGIGFLAALGYYNALAVGGAVMAFVLIRRLRVYGPPKALEPKQPHWRWPAPVWVSFGVLLAFNALAFARMLP